MIASQKYTQNSILMAGNPIDIDFSGINLTERLLITVKDGPTAIHNQPMIADHNGTNYQCIANRPILDYLVPIPFPDFTQRGFVDVPEFSKAFDIVYQTKTDNNAYAIQSMRVARAKVKKTIFNITNQEFLSRAIDWHTLKPLMNQVYPLDNLLYFLCNLNPVPASITAKVKIYHSATQVKVFDYASIAPTENTLYSLDISLSEISKVSGIEANKISCFEIFLKDEANVRLTQTKAFYPRSVLSPSFRCIWYLSTLGIWENHVFAGQRTQGREIDAFRDEYNFQQTEFYTHSFQKFTLNSGVLFPDYQAYLEYQLTHSEKIMMLEPDGSYQQIVKLSKSINTYDSLEVDESLTLEFRYINTEI